MRLLVPAYYDRFHCIAGACRHSCCIGWEIDIDEETLALYETLPSPLGDRVRESLVTEGETTFFGLTAGERCPHLNADGLCEIILEAGEEYLSDICHLHPRYRAFFSDRVEMGLGMTCEAAAKLILSYPDPVTLVPLEDDGEEEDLTAEEAALLSMRETCLRIAQDRTRPIGERLARLASLTALRMPTLSEWVTHLSSLERLDPAWDICLDAIRQDGTTPGNTGTAPSDSALEVPLEQFIVYLLYRHLSDDAVGGELHLPIAFAVMSCETLRALAHHTLLSTGSCPIDRLAEYARMWSSEIEYSTENVEKSFAFLDENQRK